MKQSCIYILASKKKGTLYIGVTSNIVQRIYQHKHKMVEGFTKKYDVNLLVYYEQHAPMETAIIKEKQMKEWQRQWKINLIERENPQWLDLYDSLV
ncbi:MAG: GIY-YIG nuclease family protein [Alphaproteobacteria bacterium]|nr:GIY-YIG nuclease family protein [Alphaproteobacteria bacterium]